MPSEESMKKAREIAVRVHASTNYSHLSEVAEEIIAEALDEAKAERKDRARELPEFLDAVFNEWGCEDPRDAADDILRFLASPVGLTEYAENSRPSLTKGPSQ